MLGLCGGDPGLATPGVGWRAGLAGWSGLGLLDGVVDAFFVIQGDGRFALGQEAPRQVAALVQDGDGGTVQAIALALELILAVFELEGQVPGEGAGLVQAEDEGQLPSAVQHGPMGINRAWWGEGETGVEVGHELGQEGVGGVDVRDAAVFPTRVGMNRNPTNDACCPPDGRILRQQSPA